MIPKSWYDEEEEEGIMQIRTLELWVWPDYQQIEPRKTRLLLTVRLAAWVRWKEKEMEGSWRQRKQNLCGRWLHWVTVMRGLWSMRGFVVIVVWSISRIWLFVPPWTVACQAPLSMEFSRQEYWSGLPFPSPGDLHDPGIKPTSPALTGRFFTTESPGKPMKDFRKSLFQIKKKNEWEEEEQEEEEDAFKMQKHWVQVGALRKASKATKRKSDFQSDKCFSIRSKQFPSLGQENPLEKEMATHSSIFSWRIPWTEEPGALWGQ